MAEILHPMCDGGVEIRARTVEKLRSVNVGIRELEAAMMPATHGFVKRQSGGHVSIESEEGQGTTIRLYFPAV